MTTQTFDEWLISRLRDAGSYAGAMDGVPGRAVFKALELFQRAEGIPVTGQADAQTIAHLRLVRPNRNGTPADHVIAQVPPARTEPVWMRDARRYLGVKEVVGPGSNPVIMSWAKKLGGWVASFFTDDDIPWCGLFAAHPIATTLPKEVLPSNPLWAKNWANFGVACSPSVGAILVFFRDGGGHVGFYVGEDRTHYHVLGGNQNNAVSITRIAKNRLVANGIRWPKTGEAQIGGRVQLTANGVPVSKNEA